jgi:GrpB-like predicted nucleotidyltransferase (UPF0157 family)
MTIAAKLRETGYENMSNAEQEKRMLLGKGYDLHDPEKQKFHIHLRETSTDIQDEIYFRDYLQQHTDIQKEYEALKMDLAQKYKNNREEYTHAKSDFITNITAIAKKKNK